MLRPTNTSLTYVAGAESPTTTCTFRDSSGAILDFSTGYTFTVTVFDTTGIKLTKTTNITGAAVDPNVQIVWSDGELALSQGTYTLQCKATHTATTRDRIFQIGLDILSDGS